MCCRRVLHVADGDIARSMLSEENDDRVAWIFLKWQQKANRESATNQSMRLTHRIQKSRERRARSGCRACPCRTTVVAFCLRSEPFFTYVEWMLKRVRGKDRYFVCVFFILGPIA